MSKFAISCAMFTGLILTQGFAENDPFINQQLDSFTPKEIDLSVSTENATPIQAPKEIDLHAPAEHTTPTKVLRTSPVVKAAFAPFTGKVVADKVRLRLQPELDSYVIRELHTNDLVSVIDQEGDFYCISPSEETKAYIFRSFVLDDVVEGNRVNVRLAPDLEAPIIGHHNSGDRVQGKVCASNKKWLEIQPPAGTRFYVAKEYIKFAGSPDLKGKMKQREEAVHQLLEAASLYTKTELEKPFDELDFDKVKQGLLAIIDEYADFPKQVKEAKDILARSQESYLQKRIAYLEEKAAFASPTTQEHTPSPVSSKSMVEQVSSALNMWESIEKALYATWAQVHPQKDLTDYYEEQKLVAVTISGVVEAFTSSVKNKPGDFVIKNKNLPVAYVYSTKVNLKDYVGKKVTLIGSPRSNHNFAFPAYYIHAVE